MRELLTDEQAYSLLDLLDAIKPADVLPLLGGDRSKTLEACEALAVIRAEIRVAEGLEEPSW